MDIQKRFMDKLKDNIRDQLSGLDTEMVEKLIELTESKETNPDSFFTIINNEGVKIDEK
jgi:hypothetical protein